MPGLPVHRYLLEFAQVNVHLRISGFNSLKFIVITGKVELCYTIFNIFGHVLFFFSFSVFIRIYWDFCCCCFLTASSLSFSVQDICCNMWGSLVAVHRLSSCDSRSCRIQISLLCGMWDLSSPTRDQTHDLCIIRRILNQWTTREGPMEFFLLPVFFSLLVWMLYLF